MFQHDLSFFIDQEGNAPRSFVGRVINSILFCDIATPITQQREVDANLLRESSVAEGAIHAYTQDLGVCGFQLLQILLVTFHLLGSTPAERENVER